MRAERPFRCTVCGRYFPWLHEKKMQTCHTCDVMTKFVLGAVREAKGWSPKPNPLWQDYPDERSDYDSDDACQFRMPWEYYGESD